MGPRQRRVTVILMVAVLLGGAGFFAAPQEPLLAQRSKGSPRAPVTVYEMSDFQCPWCRRHAVEIFPTLERDYVATGKVRWVFINFPLTQIHANAAAAAEVAMCAAKQDRFWPVHDLLYQYQDKWATLKEPGAFFLSLADSAGILKDSLATCLKAGAERPLVQADADGAAHAGATSTPTFYVEGGLLVGAQPVAVWRGILDSIYAVRAKPTPEDTPKNR
jgi:protein-disulfide isomerase